MSWSRTRSTVAFNISQRIKTREHLPVPSCWVFEQTDSGATFELVAEPVFFLVMNSLQPFISTQSSACSAPFAARVCHRWHFRHAAQISED